VIINFLYLGIGLIILIFSSEILIRGSIRLAKRFHVSEFLIGVLIISLGTSLPELSSSVNAMLHQHSDIVVGSLIGSNIANILLIMSTTVILCPILKISKDQYFQIYSNIGMVVLLCLLGFFSIIINFFIGLIFLIILMMIMFYETKFNAVQIEKGLNTKETNIIVAIFLIIIGLVGLIFGADLFVNSAIILAKQLNISEAIIGITLVAFGTSLPELTVGVVAGLRKKTGFALGNILGSNLYNIFGILGISALIDDIIIPIRIASFDHYVLLITTLFISLCIIILKKIPRIVGVIGLISYFNYILYLFYS
jgi:cation:H+ antiporter